MTTQRKHLAVDYSEDLPPLPPKTEKFVMGLLAGMTGADAFRASRDTSKWKDSSIWCQAAILKADPGVQAWLKVAHDVGVAKAVYTYEEYLSDLKRAAKLATEAGQHGAAVSALKELGIASGHRVEKREVTERKSFGDAREEVTKLFAQAQEMGLIAPGDSAKMIEHEPVIGATNGKAATVGRAGKA